MKHQEEFVKKQLLLNGFISRNFCLENYVSRLSAIIQNLEADGWCFDPKYVKGKKGRNFVYYLVSCPMKKVEYTVQGMENNVILYR